MREFRLVGAVFGAIGVIFLGIAAGIARHEARIIRTWPVVDATITRSGIARYQNRSSMWYPDLEVRYVADGREYVSGLPYGYASSSKSDMREVAEAHPVGSVCRVQYDPQDPEDVRLAEGFTVGRFFLPLIFGFLGMVMSAICLPVLVVPWLRRRRAVAAAAAVLLLTAPIGSAQTPAFELATVKPSDPAATMGIRRSGHRIATTGTSLQFLIGWAYDLHSDLIYNKPVWLDSTRFDVVASGPEDGAPAPPRVPGQPTRLQQMMQTLLAERFKLATHREKRELPFYALTVAKGGPKVQLGEPPRQMGQNPFSMPGAGRLVGAQVTAEMLANVLSGQLNRTVQDLTGLRGVFDFKLEWTPDGAPVEGATAPSLFTALQEQLGFRLEARRGPVEVLVIDRVERTPTEN